MFANMTFYGIEPPSGSLLLGLRIVKGGVLHQCVPSTNIPITCTPDASLAWYLWTSRV